MKQVSLKRLLGFLVSMENLKNITGLERRNGEGPVQSVT